MRCAVVTGATKGIGQAIAERLLREGYFVIGNYAHDDVAADNFRISNRVHSEHFLLIKLDLSSGEAAHEFARQVIRVSEQIDVLVLNCGTTDRSPFGEVTENNWMRVMNVNLNAPFFLIQDLSGNITEKDGRIILIGSLLGEYPHATSIAYGISKAAVHALALNLVKCFSARGITVNAIAPGFTDTPWQEGKDPTHRKRIENKIALRRFAVPEEIASLCMALVENQYINGAVLPIDGGYCFQ